ncbi:MAG: glycosyltransferase family 2 protein [Bacteroidota bacterium]
MLVSIITPTYNSVNFIQSTINSIIEQTYTNWELLITDDCSNDGTWEILQKFAKKDKRIKIFRLEKNSGAGVSRNNSIKHATGRYIAFCDSDDLWEPEKLEVQIQFMIENNYVFTYGPYKVVDENRNYKGTFYPPEKLNYRDMLKSCSIGCLTAAYDTEKLDKLYMPSIRKRQDYALWLEILKKIEFAYSYKETLAVYTARSRSISSNKIFAAQYQWKIYREVEQLNIIKSLYYMLHYGIRGIIKPN